VALQECDNFAGTVQKKALLRVTGRATAVCPAGTMVGNCTLVDPDLRVEIEVDAIVNSATASRGTAQEVNLDETES
jgi:hypothetical protein